MARVKTPNPPSNRTKSRPAMDPDERENQLIALAVDLVEQRLIDGTASSQETTHFLKLASRKAKLECERLALENELIKAKTNGINERADLKVLYINAMNAMSHYAGEDVYEENEYDRY